MLMTVDDGEGRVYRRFEQGDKFWEILRNGSEFTVTEGKLQTKDYKSSSAALSSFEKLVDKHLAKGFQEVKPGDLPPEIKKSTVWVDGINRRFDSIPEALDGAEPGNVIKIQDGDYRVPTLTLRKDVVLLGTGTNVTLENPDGPVFVITAEASEIRQLALRSGPNTDTVVVEGGRGVLEQCDIFSDKGAGLRVRKGAPTLNSCRVHDTHGDAVIFETGSSGLMQDCEVDHVREGAGVAVAADASPVLRNCRIHKCPTGVSARGGRFEQCQVEGNGQDWDLADGAVLVK
jgi:predicted DNA-binding WGR domain protein